MEQTFPEIKMSVQPTPPQPRSSESDQPISDYTKRVVVVMLLGICLLASYNLAMIVIGALFHDPKKCKILKVPRFLIIGSSIDLAMAVMAGATVWLTPGFRFVVTRIGTSINFSRVQSRWARTFFLLYPVVRFGVIIYGSVVVFGQFSAWDFHDSTSDTFCDLTPFVLAFVNLIADCTIFPISHCCTYLIYKRFHIVLQPPLIEIVE